MYMINKKLEKEHMGEYVVLLNTETDHSFILNETASVVFDTIEKNDMVDENYIVSQISQHFDINTDDCKRDISILLNDMLDNEIVLFLNN